MYSSLILGLFNDDFQVHVISSNDKMFSE